MKIQSSYPVISYAKAEKKNNLVESHNVSAKNSCLEGSSLECLGAYNKANVAFCGYYGDKQPAKKLFWIVSGRNHIYRDEETEQNANKCSFLKSILAFNSRYFFSSSDDSTTL